MVVLAQSCSKSDHSRFELIKYELYSYSIQDHSIMPMTLDDKNLLGKVIHVVKAIFKFSGNASAQFGGGKAMFNDSPPLQWPDITQHLKQSFDFMPSNLSAINDQFTRMWFCFTVKMVEHATGCFAGLNHTWSSGAVAGGYKEQ